MIGALKISRGALRHNARTLRDLVRPAAAAFVVKANAYGHGLLPVAQAIEEYAAAFCVYAPEEGFALRAGGVRAPIIVLGPTPVEALEDAFINRLQITVWNVEAYLETVAAIAARRSAAFPVHVKIDTGVHRLGIDSRSAPQALERVAQTKGIALTGVFSHLASAEELDSAYTMTQLQTLQSAVDSAALGGSPPQRHIAASAAAMLWPQTRLDMVRFGIGLYGLWPSQETRGAMSAPLDLRPALSFESRLIATRKVEAGTPVGYGGTFVAPRATRIGVVPLGYADGVPRMLSNRGAFIAAGERRPIAGRVCMNMTMLDLGAGSHLRPGDRVTLIGKENGASVGVDDWAGWSDSINYEIVARLPAELPRVYED